MRGAVGRGERGQERVRAEDFLERGEDWDAAALAVEAGLCAEDALERAKKAAGEKDVKIGGGVATFRQYLQARLIDSLHLAIAPVFIGQGEALFAGIDLPTLGYEIVDRQTSEHATHLVIERK